MLTSSPFFGKIYRPSLMISRGRKMPFHTQELLGAKSLLKKVEYRRYLECSNSTHTLWGCVIIIQAYFATRAWLTSKVLRMPNPPCSFGRQIRNQALGVKYLTLLAGNSHQKSLRILSIA